MRLIVILGIILLNFFTTIWSIVNYKQEKELGIKHKYGILVFQGIIWLVILIIFLHFISSFSNGIYNPIP